jgi:hypothetical protein
MDHDDDHDHETTNSIRGMAHARVTVRGPFRLL